MVPGEQISRTPNVHRPRQQWFPFRGEIGRAVWADGGNEAQLLFIDHASHVVCQDAHRFSFIAVSASAVRPEISRSLGIPQIQEPHSGQTSLVLTRQLSAVR